MAATTGEDGVDAPQDVSGGLDFAAVHGEEDARGPVEEACADGVANCADDFAREPAHAVGSVFFFGGHGEGDVFEEDGDALDGFGAEWALGAG